MEEIFDIKNAFEILQGDAPEGDVIFHVVDEKTDLLKNAGDMVMRSMDGKTEIQQDAAPRKPTAKRFEADGLKSPCLNNERSQISGHPYADAKDVFRPRY